MFSVVSASQKPAARLPSGHRSAARTVVGHPRRHFVILAPSDGEAKNTPRANVHCDKTRHADLLGEMQRLRGRIALREGATTESHLDAFGRHLMPGDERSWHLLRLQSDGKVSGCARILVHPYNVAFSGLRIASTSVAQKGVWARQVQAAVESELELARRHRRIPIEPGGWVVDERSRCTSEAILLALGAFAWAQILGDCIAFLTATVKNSSSAILRRLGGRHLGAAGNSIPPCFEPAWGCDVELLRFGTNSFNPRFNTALAAARSQLLSSPIISSSDRIQIVPHRQD